MLFPAPLVPSSATMLLPGTVSGHALNRHNHAAVGHLKIFNLESGLNRR